MEKWFEKDVLCCSSQFSSCCRNLIYFHTSLTRLSGEMVVNLHRLLLPWKKKNIPTRYFLINYRSSISLSMPHIKMKVASFLRLCYCTLKRNKHSEKRVLVEILQVTIVLFCSFLLGGGGRTGKSQKQWQLKQWHLPTTFFACCSVLITHISSSLAAAPDVS